MISPDKRGWRKLSDFSAKPTYRNSSILDEIRVKFSKSPPSWSGRANCSPSAMCDEQDALLTILYPLTLDRSVMHSLVECRGEQCQLQIFCRERWIY